LDLDLDLVGQSSEARIAFVPPVSIKDRPLLWMVVKSQTYYPEHILAYGSKKTCYSLSWVLALSGPAFRGGY
jgi:hypothetical protein